MITFKILRFTFVVYVFHKVNVLVTDIILNITSQEHLIFTFFIIICLRLFELFSKEVRVKKQPGVSLMSGESCESSIHTVLFMKLTAQENQ